MPPTITASAHRHTSALESGKAKFWVLLVGVNQYQDRSLPTLRYGAIDCQGLGKALLDATQLFPHTELRVHHDFVEQRPLLATVRDSLGTIVAAAAPQDTILFYFSGHGLLDTQTQQTFLCLADTCKQNLAETGLDLQAVLSLLGQCPAQNQVIWLDACHSGQLSLAGAKGVEASTAPAAQLLDLMRQQGAQSRGFYALLSCDQDQKSWEFPDLGHGVFTYYLIRGLQGEAADARGIIDADGLYRYVYQQTLHYIDQANQQLRFVNQQQLSRGETALHPEYSLQTPKRIVEGVGELIVGLVPEPRSDYGQPQRHALLLGEALNAETSQALCEILRQDGQFNLSYWPDPCTSEPELRNTIHDFLQGKGFPAPSIAAPGKPTQLLYLRGQMRTTADGEAVLVLGPGVQISRSWLRQELRRVPQTQQIVILDCPSATALQDWLDDLKLGSDYGQCLVVTAAPEDEPELVARVLLESLVAATPQTGLPVVTWVETLRRNLTALGIPAELWISGIHGVIEVLPQRQHPVTPPIGLEFPTKSPHAIAAPLPAASPPAEVVPPPPPQFQLTAQQRMGFEGVLANLIGPIAPTLLNRVTEQATDATSFIETLLLHLAPQDQVPCEQQLVSILCTPAASTPDTAPADTTPLPHRDRAIDREIHLSQSEHQSLEALLSDFVGPIAPLLLRQLIPESASRIALISPLLSYIPETQQAEFEQQASLLLQPSQ